MLALGDSTKIAGYYTIITNYEYIDLNLNNVTITSEEELGESQQVAMFGEIKAYEINEGSDNVCTENAVKKYVDGKIAELEQKINDLKGAGA